MKTLIVIPCKALAEGKSRLSGAIDQPARTALCESFLRRTLETAAALVPADQVRVVTADARATRIAQEYAIPAIHEHALGLNEALALARNVILASEERGCDALILPIDLPLATPAALNRVLGRTEDVVVVPDEEGDGTNLLFLHSQALPTFGFSFGPRSFARHVAGAKLAGHTLSIMREAALCFDVDRFDHYRRWRTLRIGAEAAGASSASSSREQR